MTRLSKIKAALLVGAAVAALTAAPPAQAQHYEGNHQVRFGAYLLGGTGSGDASITHIGTPFDANYDHGVYGVGVSGGLEWLRRGAWSLGVEIDGAALSGSSDITHPVGAAATTKIGYDYLATARVRGGLYLRNDVLWYGTIGAAFLGTEAKTGSLKVQSTQTGLAAGTGLEYDFGGGLFFAEYLYAGFGDIDASTATTSYTYDATLHTFRVGVKFKVGHDWYHDDVAARTGRPMK